MYPRKRKSSFSYYQDDEEEDIWEREASVASSSNRNTKSTPPSLYTKEIDILDNQYEILQKTEIDLRQELQHLQASLQALGQNEIEEQTELRRIEGEYLATVQEAIAFYEHQLKDTQSTNTDETITITNDTTYLKIDALLIKEIKRIMEDWRSVFSVENQEDINSTIDATSHQYRKTEFDVVDLIAQISGYEARIQTLNRDRARLNSLPQILPIIRSETERYASEMKETTIKLEQLEKDVIRPYLDKVAIQRVFYPLYASFITNELKLAQDYLEDLEFLYTVCIKQRSYQQLTTLLYEKDATQKMQKVRSLKLLALEQQPDRKEDATEVNDDEPLVSVIKGLLKKVLNQIGDDATDLTLAEQIETLQRHASILKQKWQDDFQSCQDAANELNLLHKRLSDTLYSNSRSSNELVMAPKTYTTLQEELEFRTMELKTTLSVLQKEANDSNKRSLFEQQRKLFSLFYTDPLTFEHLHTDI